MKSSTNCTRGSPSGKPSADLLPRQRQNRKQRFGPVAILLLAGLGAVVAAGGCAPRARIHADFDHLRPKTVALLPVVNETLHQLDAVQFGGLLQRGLLGPQTHDIPLLLRGAVEDGLRRRGYAVSVHADGAGADPVDFHRPLPAGAPAPPFEAACLTTIETWEADNFSSSNMSMRYRLELYHVPTATLLFSGSFECWYKEDARSRGGDELQAAMRRSARSALSSLPPAGA